MNWLRYLGLAGLGVVLGAASVSACSADDNTNRTASNFGSGGSNTGGSGNVGGGAASGGGGGTGGSGASFQFDSGTDDGGQLTADAACAQQSAEATLVKKPVDVVFIVDNSCSMSQEILAIQDNINKNFKEIIEASGVDYRVILISDHGDWNGPESICIGPPLSTNTDCPNGIPGNNPPIFYHYDHGDVLSHDSLCKLLDWYSEPDVHGFTSVGWREWLRPDAVKAFVEVTDDGVTCTSTTSGNSYDDNDNVADGQNVAVQFDQDLLALDPAQFGTAAERNYIWYSLVGMAAKANPLEAYQPTEPEITGQCSSGQGAGTAYQSLSNMTEGLKFPVCEGNGFDVVFQKIAEGVIAGAKVACEFPIPPPPDGEEIDLETVVVEYTPGPGVGGSAQRFDQVASAAGCTPGKFYIEGQTIKLCPGTCTTVEDDDAAKIQVLFDCVEGGPA